MPLRIRRPESDEPTAEELRRWLTHPSGRQLPFPQEFREDSETARAAFAAWVHMHDASDEAAIAERRFGYTSEAAYRARLRARREREEMLRILGKDADELKAEYGWDSERGRNALALGRY